ncbi:MAG: helicase-related protein [Kiritimatiellia bacterium]
MSTRFFTNRRDNTLIDKFAGVFSNNPDIRFFDALIGYFRSSGYFALRPYIQNLEKIRILVGIDVDQRAAQCQARGLLFDADAPSAIETFMAAVKADIAQAHYDATVEAGILQFIEDVATKKVEMRAHPSRKLHAKIYIFRPTEYNEHKHGNVITGSSNLTDAGMGTGKGPANYEFNVLLNQYDDVVFATEEFEALWAEGIDILPARLAFLKEETYLNDAITPYELYLKFLVEYFGRGVEFDPSASEDLPEGFKRLNYQTDAVNQGFDLMRKHNGFFLADVVGLGKTIVACQIAKKFFFSNGYPVHIGRTLIIVPPAMRDSWQETIAKFQLHNVDIVSSGSLHKVKHPERFDLVIVDEAHKFRNDSAGMYDQLQRICKTQVRNNSTNRLEPKKVILISATPLNNSPKDIYNLLLLFQHGKETTLDVANLQSFFVDRMDEWKEARQLPTTEARKAVMAITQLIREKILSPITVRRTRTDLKEQEPYRKDLEAQGIVFPETGRPQKIFYILNPAMDIAYDRTLAMLSDTDAGLTYNRYRAIQFLKTAELKAKYPNADRVSIQLATIMKTLLVKRLDSSFHAFRKSLHRFRDATAAMVSMFATGRVFIAPDYNVSEYILEDREEELIDLLTTAMVLDPSIIICTPDDFAAGFLTGLRHDLIVLDGLCADWDAFKGSDTEPKIELETDPKFDTFVAKLPPLFDPAQNPSGKLVVFTESAETAAYLAERLTITVPDQHVLCIDSSNRKEKQDIIRANFDANLEPRTLWRDDFPILITTEVLAEGVNLHRANTVVNYDTPWNATRLMQRLGRVNRIGATASFIHNIVFFPTSKVDRDIDLHKKAVMKLQAFHTALGEDSQIYSETEEIDSFGLFDRNIQEERDERLDYLMELRRYKAEQPGEFRRIKALPVRARTGRANKAKSGGTVAFIRNRRRDAFTLIPSHGDPQDLSFVECARELHAKPSEKSVPLPPGHHEQVRTAVEHFASTLQAELTANRKVTSKHTPSEQSALALLKTLSGFHLLGPEEQHLCRVASEAVGKVKFQKLAGKLATLARQQKKEPKPVDLFIERALAILKTYPLLAPSNPDAPDAPQVELTPDIIISESFV